MELGDVSSTAPKFYARRHEVTSDHSTELDTFQNTGTEPHIRKHRHRATNFETQARSHTFQNTKTQARSHTTTHTSRISHTPS
uniref:Uncharacterized protein n=1 Tax=Arundo donax TaxID=35708 RepID=A0A0A9CDX2_ARUDO